MNKRYTISIGFISIGLIILYLAEIFFAARNIKEQVCHIDRTKSGVRRPPP